MVQGIVCTRVRAQRGLQSVSSTARNQSGLVGSVVAHDGGECGDALQLYAELGAVPPHDGQTGRDSASVGGERQIRRVLGGQTANRFARLDLR
jgi:hypothetical protein